MKLTLLLLLSIWSLFCGCEPTMISSNTEILGFGPRWTDYEEWGKLSMGLTTAEVLQIMGEPYLPQQSYVSSDKTTNVLVFEIKPKWYPTRVITNVVTTDFSGGQHISNNGAKQQKPEKFAKFGVWGPYCDLLCVFENNKLVKWYCPQVLDSVTTNNEFPQSSHEKKE